MSRYKFTNEPCGFTLQEQKFTFEKKLHQAKERHGLTWAELGDRLEIGKTMLHYLKTGQREPSEKVIRRLSLLNESEPGAVNPSLSVYPECTSPDRKDMVVDRYPPQPPMKIEDRLEMLERQHAEMLQLLSEIRNDVKGRVPNDGKKDGESTDGH